jgi:hypothetical protein
MPWWASCRVTTFEARRKASILLVWALRLVYRTAIEDIKYLSGFLLAFAT